MSVVEKWQQESQNYGIENQAPVTIKVEFCLYLADSAVNSEMTKSANIFIHMKQSPAIQDLKNCSKTTSNNKMDKYHILTSKSYYVY